MKMVFISKDNNLSSEILLRQYKSSLDCFSKELEVSFELCL